MAGQEYAGRFVWHNVDQPKYREHRNRSSAPLGLGQLQFYIVHGLSTSSLHKAHEAGRRLDHARPRIYVVKNAWDTKVRSHLCQPDETDAWQFRGQRDQKCR